jgi:hypothetical protein
MTQTNPTHSCIRCGNSFTPRVFWQRFCSAKCRKKHGAEALQRDLVLVRAMRQERGK